MGLSHKARNDDAAQKGILNICDFVFFAIVNVILNNIGSEVSLASDHSFLVYCLTTRMSS